jgi:predicted XRE-type DNA-binding protein
MKRGERREIGEADVTIKESSGNVFVDLDLENPEELLAKSALVHQICTIAAECKFTGSQAADLLGIGENQWTALTCGDLDRFSIDRLFRFLNALGKDVEIIVRPARLGQTADTRVVAV